MIRQLYIWYVTYRSNKDNTSLEHPTLKPLNHICSRIKDNVPNFFPYFWYFVDFSASLKMWKGEGYDNGKHCAHHDSSNPAVHVVRWLSFEPTTHNQYYLPVPGQSRVDHRGNLQMNGFILRWLINWGDVNSHKNIRRVKRLWEVGNYVVSKQTLIGVFNQFHCTVQGSREGTGSTAYSIHSTAAVGPSTTNSRTLRQYVSFPPTEWGPHGLEHVLCGRTNPGGSSLNPWSTSQDELGCGNSPVAKRAGALRPRPLTTRQPDSRDTSTPAYRLWCKP